MCSVAQLPQFFRQGCEVSRQAVRWGHAYRKVLQLYTVRISTSQERSSWPVRRRGERVCVCVCVCAWGRVINSSKLNTVRTSGPEIRHKTNNKLINNKKKTNLQVTELSIFLHSQGVVKSSGRAENLVAVIRRLPTTELNCTVYCRKIWIPQISLDVLFYARTYALQSGVE